MRYDIRKNWVASYDLIRNHSIVILPFIFIAFFNAVALEFVFFSTRRPLSLIAGPVIRKFFGENFLHYPGHLLILPKLFYYCEVLIYVFIGIFLTAVSINMFKNIRTGLPLKPKALFKNASKRYFSYLTFGLIVMALIFFLKKADMFIFRKIALLGMKFAPEAVTKLYAVGLSLFLFITNIIMQIFLVLTLPLMVIRGKSLAKAIAGSIKIAFTNFLTVFGLTILPFLLYLPIALLKGESGRIAEKAFPETTLLISAAGIIVAIFVDCFIAVCTSQYLMDTQKTPDKE